jgi:molybdopterin-dependent oxidoreductase alpha subunit
MTPRDPSDEPHAEAAPKLNSLGGMDPRLWAGFVPNGFGQVKPNHFGEIWKTAWQNRAHLPYAWRILTKGVCDGCALGTAGLKDFTMPGVHLCTVRLNLLHLNTRGALDPQALADVSALRARSSRELRDLGRLAWPMIRRKGEQGFTRVTWDQALDAAAAALAPVLARDPDRFACFVTSRGITNEVYYALQKTVRLLGTNNVDNSARLCHAPSTVVLKQMLGATGSTCSYSDWIGTDLLVFVGSDAPNNQPVTTKYIYYAKQNGTKVVVVNPLREPGLERYWIPSVLESAVFGTKLADEWFGVHTGGDRAFFGGVLKALIDNGGVDRAWVAAHTEGFADVEAALAAQPWPALEAESGTTRAEMERFAGLYAQAKRVVFVWSMGVTQHAHGSDQVRAIVNLALARGMVGRPRTGLVPIRGHSGVQGGSEMGCVPYALPGGEAIAGEGRARFSAAWGFDVPDRSGLDARAMIEAAHDGRLDAFHVVGGNFLETLPDPDYVERALARLPLRMHQDIVVTSQMLVDPADVVILFPARTRYEQSAGGTETSTERRILMSPEIRGGRPGEVRDEWRPLADLAARLRPDRASAVGYFDAQRIRDEIGRLVPMYFGIQRLRDTGDQVQYGGPRLAEGGKFDRPGGRARFAATAFDAAGAGRGRGGGEGAGTLRLSTRRGKQFNSIVHADRDPLTGAMRDDVLIAPEDLARLGIADGEAIVVRSPYGTLEARAKGAPLVPGNAQGHWPEVNVLLGRDRGDRESGVPDYNVDVTIERARAREEAR